MNPREHMQMQTQTMKKHILASGCYTLMTALLLIAAGCGTDSSTDPAGSDYADLTIVVRDDFNRPVVGGNLSSNPPTNIVVTDSVGRATFKDMPVREYTIYLRRPNFPVYTMNLIPDPGNQEEIAFQILSESPSSKIIFPNHVNFVSVYNIRFGGRGTDPEDGVLPDSSLVWTSNVDGLLGYGSELEVETMTNGRHSITLEVMDSDNKTGFHTIDIIIVDYHPDSYFPLPTGAEWIYGHLHEKFSLVNTSGNIESWVLYNVAVSIGNNNVRTSTMSYKVQVVNQAREYRYTIMDYIATEGNKVTVSKTYENIKIWKGNPFGTPSDELNINTVYTPEYVILDDVMTPETSATPEDVNHVEVTWSYKDPFFGIREFTESFSIHTAISVGAEETITASNISYDAVPVTITQQGSIRKWWLVKGLGLVQFDYNAFAIPPNNIYPTAYLVTSNLANLTQRPAESAPVSRIAATSGEPVNDTPIPAEEGYERMKALRGILNGLSPR